MSARLPRVPKLHSNRLRSLRRRLRLSIRDASQTDISPNHTHDAHNPFWELEPTPLVITAEDWEFLEGAVSQRARLVNAFLRDIYGNRDALRQRIVPPEIVLSDPYYRRPCQDLEPGRECPATMLRLDLVKTKSGWVCAGVHTNTPIGLSYVVQNRRFMTQEAGDIYAAMPDYHSIINSPLELLEHLRALSPKENRNPSIIVLTSGVTDPFFPEHSFLARKMGLPLARGGDLLVLDNHVYFKTIAGLKQVDVIYRRLNDRYIDPAVVATTNEDAGVPGLLQCIRAGNVVITNAIGSGVAESRGLEPYWAALSKFYLGEKLRLPGLATYNCGDVDQLDTVIDSADPLHIRPTHDILDYAGTSRVRSRLLAGKRLPKHVRENPFNFVVQALPKTATLPARRPGAPEFRLSLFALTRPGEITVIPGGLVQLASRENDTRIGRSSDALVFCGQSTSGEVADYEAIVASGINTAPLGSRAAEHLFWLGRYLERAESTARMLSIIDDVVLEEIPSGDRRRWLPLWRGLLVATGQSGVRIDARSNLRKSLSSSFLTKSALGTDNPGSLFCSAQYALRNAAGIRDYVSPEAWSILNRLASGLERLARHPDSTKKTTREDFIAAIQLTMTEVNAFLGMAERTMLLDAGWQFLRMGAYLERGNITIDVLEPVLGALDRDQTDRPRALQEQLIYQDNPELAALLRMMGSQDAYRRLYQTRSQPRFVAELFLQQRDVPHSVAHCMAQLRESLAELAQDFAREEPVTQQLAIIEDQLIHLNLEPYFQPRSMEPQLSFSERLTHLGRAIRGLHQVLDDHYFNHQANLFTRDLQIPLGL